MASSTIASVNKPVDVKAKDADVNRKLQIYGIITAFQHGKVPSNDQIDVALNSFLASRPLARPSERLSPEGRALVEDFRGVVKQAQHLVLSKNEGNLVQDFIWQTTQFDPQSVTRPGAPVDKDTAKAEGDRALEGLRTLGTLLITNGQFRKLLKDATILLKDMAGDAATKAATSVRPSEDDVAQIDRPADDNIWHDTPDVSRGNIKAQIQGLYKATNDAQGGDRAGAGPALDQNQGQSTTVGNGDSNGPAGVAGSGTGTSAAPNHDSQPGQGHNEQIDRLENGTSNAKEAGKNKEDEYRTRVKKYLSRKMPKDRREQVVWRLKKTILECQQHPDYRQAVQTLLDLAERYKSHARALGQGSSNTVKDARTGLGQAERDLRTLIERFANGTSTENLWASISQVYRDADNDPELKNWLEAMNQYIRRCLEEQGYILEDTSTDDWNRLYDEGNYLLRDKYKDHTDRIIDEVKFIVDQFDQDPQNKSFAASVKKLFTDLGNDENGKPTFKRHLVKDLTDVIIPSIFENVAYIPIPRIEYSDSRVDAIIENLVLESDNFMPNVLEIVSENYMRWDRKKLTSKSRHSMEVKVAGVQMDLRDVSYHVKRKQGFPSLTDTGVADLFLGGSGLAFKLKLSTAVDKDSQKLFKVDKVDVDVEHLKIKLRKSSHKLLFNIAKPLMLMVLRPAMQKAAEKAIRENFEKLDQLFFRIKEEADRAQEEAMAHPEKIPNVYRRYVIASQKQALQARKKAEGIAADKKVNYAVTKADSMFPDIHLPGGISSKATEYRELALKGERWESPVFSIGTASRSTDIPPPPQIVRKNHAVSGDRAQHTLSANGNRHPSGQPATGHHPQGLAMAEV